jgi:hypothetical protein
LLIIAERIAIVGEGQSQNAYTQHGGDTAERNASPGLTATIENDIGTGFPARGVLKDLDPSGGMEDAARSFLYERLPDRVGPGIYTDNIHLALTFRYQIERWIEGNYPTRKGSLGIQPVFKGGDRR